MVYIDENIEGIAQRAADAKLFVTQKRALWFFKEYMSDVESLFRRAEILEDNMNPDTHVNSLPFITLDSNFTLTDIKGRIAFCHMTYDLLSDRHRNVKEVYFLSPAGRALLWKEAGDYVRADIGAGLSDYKINSIQVN